MNSKIFPSHQERLLKFLEVRDRSSTEVAKFLSSFHYDQNTITGIIIELTQSGLINDRRFCENRILSRLKLNFRGRDLVRSELISIGLDQDIIDESIAKVPEQEWLQAALNIGAKYLKSKSERNQKNLFNLKNKLYRNGFDEESVEFVLKHFGIKAGSVTDGN